MSKKDAYTEQMKALLPSGEAFSQQKGTVLETVLSIFATEFAKIDDRSLALVNEADPRSVIEMLEEWEKVAGLPDPCIGTGGTFQERRDLLVQRVTSLGGQSLSFFIGIATLLGYTITIKEHKPFTTGKSKCGNTSGGAVTSDKKIRYHWTVTVPNARLTNFKTGASKCGENLGKFSNADDLVCVFTRLKPAHTTMHFNYQGV